MPPSTHSAADSNLISPRPVDMPLSQGDVLLCFAYATADMISQRVHTEISALDVATKYYFTDPSRLTQLPDRDLQLHLERMGDVQTAIARSRSKTDISGVRNPRRYPYVDKLEGGEEDIAALIYNVGGLCEDRDLPSDDGYTHFENYLAHLRFRAQLSLTAPQCEISLGGTIPEFRSPRTDAFNATWIAHVERLCHRRPLPVPLLPISYRIASSEGEFMELLEAGRAPSAPQENRMFSMIDYALDHDRAPAVGYRWFVFRDPDATETDLVADHSSVIIGRRKVGDVCQYQVQDNTGEYCSHMRKGIRERCELGRIWLTEEELKHSLYSVTYLR